MLLHAVTLRVLPIFTLLLQVCVASGKAVRDAPWQRCKTCKRAMITAELAGRRSCPLCHSQLPQEAGKGRGLKQARIIEGAAA
jgi:Zn finger protein HypA/HybF involved in hydrogenase expression